MLDSDERKEEDNERQYAEECGVINLGPVPNGTLSPRDPPPSPYFAAWAAG